MNDVNLSMSMNEQKEKGIFSVQIRSFFFVKKGIDIINML
jgi:hypothetical protein